MRMLKSFSRLVSRASVLTLLFAFPAKAESVLYLPKPAPPAWWNVSGQSWAALFVGGRSAQLRYELKTVRAKIYIDSRDKILKLGAQNSPDPIVFIDDSTLRDGPVKAATGVKFGVATALQEKSGIQFQFGNKGWKLTRETSDRKNVSPERADANVTYTLEGDGKSQSFGPIPCRLNLRFNQSVCAETLTFNFIGDLDRDGRPDFYWIQNRSQEVGVSEPWLWLSKTSRLSSLADSANAQLFQKPFRAIVKQGKLQSSSSIEILIPYRLTRPLTSTSSFDAWWGLQVNSSGHILDSLKIFVACIEGQCEEQNYIGLSSRGAPKLLVRGLKGLKRGALEHATIEALPQHPDKEMNFDSFRLKFRNQTLQLVGGSGLFTLESERKKTAFPLKTMDPDQKPKLFWAGDLDHDGFVDLVFETPEDEGVGYTLYVSPEAATGPIAGPSAQTFVFPR